MNKFLIIFLGQANYQETILNKKVNGDSLKKELIKH